MTVHACPCVGLGWAGSQYSCSRSGVWEGRVPKATWEGTAGKEGASNQVGSVFLLNLICLPGACTSRTNFNNQGEGTLQESCTPASVFLCGCVHVHTISLGDRFPVSVELAAPGNLAACVPAHVCIVLSQVRCDVSCNRPGVWAVRSHRCGGLRGSPNSPEL